jgi:hypothetical protein
MEHLKVAELIEALNLVGRVIRGKDGSKPLPAITAIIAQLDHAPRETLGEWADAVRARPNGKKSAKPKPPAETVEVALARLERADTQHRLHEEIGRTKLSAANWKKMSKMLTGKPGGGGDDARDRVETHLSNRLLLDDRVQGARRLFG